MDKYRTIDSRIHKFDFIPFATEQHALHGMNRKSNIR